MTPLADLLELLRTQGVQRFSSSVDGVPVTVEFFPMRGAAVEAKKADEAPQASEAAVPPLLSNHEPQCACGHSIFSHNAQTGYCLEACEPSKCNPSKEGKS